MSMAYPSGTSFCVRAVRAFMASQMALVNSYPTASRW